MFFITNKKEVDMTINIPTNKVKTLTKKTLSKTFKFTVKSVAVVAKTGKHFVREVRQEMNK